MKPLVVYCLWLMTMSEAQQPGKDDAATLILYREKDFYLRQEQGLEFTINDKDRIRLSANHYVQLRVTAGRVKIHHGTDYLSAEKSKTLWLSAQPGRTYYVKIAIDIDFMRATLLMAPVSEAEACQELRRMKPEKPSSGEPD